MKRLFISLSLALSFLFGTAPMALAAATTCPAGTIELSSPLASGVKCVDASKPGGPIFAYLGMVIKFLSGAVGLVIVLMIVVGGVQYITSAGDPASVKAAKTRITNAITGLILFVLMFALLNFLIPGGIIN
jgi:hypothetical protein